MWRAFWSWYFEPKRFERAGGCRIYRLAGVRIFKRYLPTSGDLVSRWRGISRIKRTDGGLRLAVVRYERITRSYEARHIFGALSMLAINWWAIAVHGKGSWIALLAANALINGYPMMIQRYNRVRLEAARARLEARGPVRQRGSRPDADSPESSRAAEPGAGVPGSPRRHRADGGGV